MKIPGALVRVGGFITSPRVYLSIAIHERRGPLEPLAYVILFSASKWGLRGLLVAGLAASAIGSFGVTPLEAVTDWAAPWLTSLLVYGAMAIGVLFELFLWFMWSLFAHALAKSFNGGGEYAHSLNAVGYAWVTDSASLASLLVAVASPRLALIALLGAFVAWVWKGVVVGIGMSEAHGISLGKGLASSFLPWLILAVVGSAIFFLATSWEAWWT